MIFTRSMLEQLGCQFLRLGHDRIRHPGNSIADISADIFEALTDAADLLRRTVKSESVFLEFSNFLLILFEFLLKQKNGLRRFLVLLFENLQIIYKRNEYLDIVMETVRKFLLFKGRAQHDS